MHAGTATTHDILRKLAEGTAATTGQEFFRALVGCAAQALGVSGIWVTEYIASERSLRALAFWFSGRYIDEYHYPIDGTPCEPVIDNTCLVNYPDRVIELFPDDPDLPGLNAVSYAGIPLLAPDGLVLGHLALLHNEPFVLTPELESIFRIFASRAAVELTRIRAESSVRASEQRYARLFESAMDAILELDSDLRIRRANSATEKAFRVSAEDLVGRSIHTLLTDDSRRVFSSVLASLQDLSSSNSWIPGGLRGIRSDGSVFPAEASLSRFPWEGAWRCCVILRNVEEQLASESRLRRLEAEAAYLQDEIAELRREQEISGHSPAILRVISAIHQVAPAPTSVLIMGETGTGKELVARAIHQSSPRAGKPFIRVNCAAIPSSLSESEFFGHEKGAFTGAIARRVGRFEAANNGTIFLDEVGELPLDLQAKLLRVLQEGEFEPVGSSQLRKVDVRVIAATNRDLLSEVRAGRFREDLYYRLNVFPIVVPPLRERGADVELLAELFIERYCRKMGRPVMTLDPDCLRRLRSYDWPGNVRELENVIERAVIVSRGNNLVLRDALPVENASRATSLRQSQAPGGLGTRAELKQLEKASILRALEAANWKVAGPNGAARQLGIPASTLSSRMKALGIQRPSK